MKYLEHAKQLAREFREELGWGNDGLLERLKQYLEKQHRIKLCATSASSIEHGKAEIVPEDRCLYYARALEAKPEEKLFAVVHEIGHLLVHKRLTDLHDIPDPLRDSIYTRSDGAAAIARYSDRSLEEDQANAFAKEFLCPKGRAFEEWRSNPSVTSKSIAERIGTSEEVVRVQLAESLYDCLLAVEEDKRAERRVVIQDNEIQREAATHLGGPAIVNAGPGTGKTSTLIMRIEFLLGAKKVSPKQILVLTFSNDAAEELRERVSRKFGPETANDINILTFHSFGYSFLLDHALDLDEDFTILDEASQEELVTAILGNVECDSIINLRDPAETAHETVRQIGHLKDRLKTEDDLRAAIHEWIGSDPAKTKEQENASDFLKLFGAYEKAKIAYPAVDFADLISMPLNTMRMKPDLVKKFREKYKWVMVDEYQDVSAAMAYLLGLICGEHNPPWVVGDIRQAIYRFRGADPDENVRLFFEQFPEAKTFDLDINYRSCEEVILAANQLATLLEKPDHSSAEHFNQWRRGAGHLGLAAPVVSVARANSDEAEQAGVASIVRSWIDEKGVQPGDIAVLARRNIDVRNIVLALGRQGIKALTNGLITPEGAAGDMAAVVTLIDAPRPSLARVIYSLGRDRFNAEALNDVIFWLYEVGGKTPGDEGSYQESLGEASGLVDEYSRILTGLERERFNGDAFTMMCTFLFDGSDYLRRILEDPDEAKQSLIIGEIVTSLTRAAGYRFSHTGVPRNESRIGFAQHFRANLSSSTPVLAAPRSHSNSVRVMTCHASKGLEFPCVVVAGQTLPLANNRTPWWMPPKLRQSAESDKAQADSLLFVGLTRAQRVAIISYAETRSGTSGSTQRELPKLLERWQSVYDIPSSNLPEKTSVRTTAAMRAFWGGSPKGKLPARLLDKRYCAIKTYLEDFVGIRFPENLKSLYSRFFVAVRAAMEKVVKHAQDTGHKVTDEEAKSFFAKIYRESELSEHLHNPLYSRVGASFVERFARAYEPRPGKLSFFEMENVIEETEEKLLPLRLDLVVHYHDEQGVTHALLYRPESLAKYAKGGVSPELNWSSIKDGSKLIGFVLLRRRHRNLQPWVFSAADGKLYKYKLHRDPAKMEENAEAALATLRALTQGTFQAEVDEWACDSCRARIACPHWMGAIST
jgi:DNA helicase II / ATP-dependent DNA helicase PcrA